MLGLGAGVGVGGEGGGRGRGRGRGKWGGRGLGVRVRGVGVELGGVGGALWARAGVRALGPGVGQGAGVDGAICWVPRLGGNRIDLGLLCLVALVWESGRGSREGGREGLSAGAVRGGGRTLGSVNAARKQRKSSPVVPRRRLASASAHLKAAVAVVSRVQYPFYYGYYCLRLVRARVRMSLPLTQLEL